jgi:hypothetical protein
VKIIPHVQELKSRGKSSSIDWIKGHNNHEKTTVGKVGPEKIDDEIRRVTRYEEWCNLVEDSESEDDEQHRKMRKNKHLKRIGAHP